MRWTLKALNAALAAKLGKELGLYSIVAAVLTQRGVIDEQSARGFINPDLHNEWSSPESIPGMLEVADALENAIRCNKRIVIFGDYDVDGITASAIVYNALKELGITSQVVLPLREGEGYGLSEQVIERIIALDPEMVLTVDCGITADAEISLLLEQGIEVLVTDHHEAADEVVLTVPAADPKLDKDCEQAILSGAGVALKLAALLCSRFDKHELWKSQLDLAALGTIADSMSLLKENRALVSEGLKFLNSHPRPGVLAVQEISGKSESMLSAEDLAYGLIPRLNAAGRVSDPCIAFDLLCSQDYGNSLQLARRLEDLNKERKRLESALLDKAVRQIEPFEPNRSSLVVGGESWHEGVRGIVANRIVQKYGVPAIVFSFEDGQAIGSGRTVGSINLHSVVNELSDLLLRFGGHEAAIGLTIEQRRIDEFSERLEAIMSKLPEEEFSSSGEIDCKIGFEHISTEAVEELKILEPFGRDNPEPLFLTTGLLLKSPRYVGAGERHVALTLSDGVQEFSAIWFNMPYQNPEDIPAISDVVYSLRIDEWRGRRTIKMHILDVLSEPLDGEEKTAAEGEKRQEELQQLLLLGSRQELYRYLANSISGREVSLRAAQLKCLQTLEDRQSTLAIMATGRGKSLIFHTFSASMALDQGRPSLFIYPLRSLINDQEYFLTKTLSDLGLACASLTGTTLAIERERIYEGVINGSVQLVLSTPEFVIANAKKASFWSEFEFVVIDEAHHIATSGESFRPDYTRLEALKVLMPRAVFLGLSATSDKATTDAIVKSLNIQQIVIDSTKRPNLLVDDKRDTALRDKELVAIVEASSRVIVYVSSRVASLDLCRILRKELPEQAHRIAFYNAALEASDRQKVEESFRSGALDCLIATSAFGEGVNVGDVQDVVLYDLPYSVIDFNQMAGRAGRDGRVARIHILAQRSDADQLLQHLTQDMDANQDTAALEERQRSIREIEFFKDWLFEASADELSSVIQKPLTPLGEHEE